MLPGRRDCQSRRIGFGVVPLAGSVAIRLPQTGNAAQRGHEMLVIDDTALQPLDAAQTNGQGWSQASGHHPTIHLSGLLSAAHPATIKSEDSTRPR